MTTNSNQRPKSLDEWMNEQINKCIKGRRSCVDAVAMEHSAWVGKMMLARKYRNDADLLEYAKELVTRVEMGMRRDRQEIMLEQT